MTKQPPSLGRLWKTGSIYMASFWLSSAMPLLLTPILTRYLSPSDYGVTAMWQVLLNLTIPLIGISTHGAINRRYFRNNENPALHHLEMRDYIASVIPILAVTSLVVVISYALLHPLIIKHFLPVSPVWIWMVPAVAIISFIYNIALTYLNAEMRAKTYALLSNGNIFVTNIVGVALVVGLGWNWQGRVMGGIAGVTTAAAVGLIYLWRRGLLGGSIRRDMTMHALLFSLPLLPHILAHMLRGISDRVFLRQIADLHEVGLFSVALTMTGVFAILGGSVTQAWIPWLYSHLGKVDVDRKRIVKITYVAFATLAVVGVAFATLAPFVFGLLLGPRFEGSTQFVWWLTGAAVLQGAYYFVVPYIAYVERNKYSSYISMTTLAVNLCLNVILINFFGVMGVAAANFFTALFEFSAVFIVANYCMPMPWMSFFRTGPTLDGITRPGADIV